MPRCCCAPCWPVPRPGTPPPTPTHPPTHTPQNKPSAWPTDRPIDCIFTINYISCYFTTLGRFQKTPLDEARVVFYGAGSSAVGVADQIATYMQQKAGISNEEARRRIFMVRGRAGGVDGLPAFPFLFL